MHVLVALLLAEEATSLLFKKKPKQAFLVAVKTTAVAVVTSRYKKADDISVIVKAVYPVPPRLGC